MSGLHFGLGLGLGVGLRAGGAAASFTMNAGNWPGTLAMRRDATGAIPADSGVFTFATWVKMGGSDTAAQFIFNVADGGTTRFRISRATDGKVAVNALSAAGTNLINTIKSTNSLVGATGWKCLMVSGDRAGNAGAGKLLMYLDDTQEINGNWTAASADIGFSNSERFSIGGDWFASSSLTADLGNLYFSTAHALDLTDENVRRKFIDSLAQPVDLGADGSTPSGAQPVVYMGNPGDYADWNAGTTLNLGSLSAGAAWSKVGTGNVTEVFF